MWIDIFNSTFCTFCKFQLKQIKYFEAVFMKSYFSFKKWKRENPIRTQLLELISFSYSLRKQNRFCKHTRLQKAIGWFAVEVLVKTISFSLMRHLKSSFCLCPNDNSYSNKTKENKTKNNKPTSSFATTTNFHRFISCSHLPLYVTFDFQDMSKSRFAMNKLFSCEWKTKMKKKIESKKTASFLIFYALLKITAGESQFSFHNKISVFCWQQLIFRV